MLLIRQLRQACGYPQSLSWWVDCWSKCCTPDSLISLQKGVHDTQPVCKVNYQEILTLFVAFEEAIRSKGSAKFGGVQVVECADV